MNAREHVDLTKMAITAMLLVLVLSAALSLFYLLYKVLNDTSSGTEQIVSSTSTEKLYDLTNATRSGDKPWVSSVINALSKLEDKNVLYVQVSVYGEPNARYFTYKDVTLSGVASTLVTTSEIPMDECCKYLLSYTNRRCQIQLIDNYSYGGLTFSYVTIDIQRKE